MSEFAVEYIKIICNRINHPLSKEEYGEVHHIIPRSCGGEDSVHNRIRLKPEEHYRCHELLPQIYADGEKHRKMAYAWHIIQGRLKLKAKDYAVVKEMYSKVSSEFNRRNDIKPPSRKGKVVSEETRKRLSLSHKGQKPNSGCFKKGSAPWNKGKSGCFSEETRKKMSKSQRKRFDSVGTSEDTRKKMSKSQRKRHELEHKKEVKDGAKND